MEAYRVQEGLARAPITTVRVDMGPDEAKCLQDDLAEVLDALKALDPERAAVPAQTRVRLAQFSDVLSQARPKETT